MSRLSLRTIAEEPNGVAENVFRLTTIRSHNQYNTTIYGKDDSYRGVFGRRDVVFMSKADPAAHNLEPGDVVDVETALPGGDRNRLEGFTLISYDIAHGSVAAYYPKSNPFVLISYRSRITTRKAARALTNPSPCGLRVTLHDAAPPEHQTGFAFCVAV
jgi:anaerobic selenocysteine-containing dehydrogenase